MGTASKNIREALRIIESAGLRVLEIRHDARPCFVTDRGVVQIPESPSSFNSSALRWTVRKLAGGPR
jgi:hypothetical protein